jgi:hypothetical protein
LYIIVWKSGNLTRSPIHPEKKLTTTQFWNENLEIWKSEISADLEIWRSYFSGDLEIWNSDLSSIFSGNLEIWKSDLPSSFPPISHKRVEV